MLAAVTRSPGEMVVEDVPGPRSARAGNVIVRPEADGVCGSDFHLFSGDVGALSGAKNFYPRIQGHEVSAIVEDPGDSQAKGTQAKDSQARNSQARNSQAKDSHGTLARGDRVAIWPLLPCHSCYPCRINRPNVCVRFRLVGVHLDGGLQERLEIPAGDFRRAIGLVSAHRASLTALFSHHFPLARTAEAFAFAMSRPPDAIKIIVTVN